MRICAFCRSALNRFGDCADARCPVGRELERALRRRPLESQEWTDRDGLL